MSELRVVAVLTATPGSADVIRDVLLALAAATREEEGCVSYELFASDAADTFVTVETWRDAADLKEHLASPHLAAAMKAGRDHFAGQPAIHQLTPLT